jgi:hypothetical protein
VRTRTHTLRLTDDELRLLWLGTETLAEANPDDPNALSLDRKTTALIEQMQKEDSK